MALSGIVYRGFGVDWYFGLLQSRGADDVPILDAGAGIVDVFASAAGRHGSGQRRLGMDSSEVGCTFCSQLGGTGTIGGIDQHSAAPVNGGGVENVSGCGA